MAEAFEGTYIIQLDVDWWGWGDELNVPGFDYEFIPIFYALDEQGKPTGETIVGDAWGDDNIPENMAPMLKDFFVSAGN
jgi:hypothetical protein